MPRISKHPDIRKNEIVEAAQELFATKGYEQTAVSDIVKKVGVAQGTFYYYFNSKDEILNIVLDAYIDNLIQKVRIILEDIKLDALQKLRAIAKEAFSFGKGKGDLVEYFHREKNAVMHQRASVKMIEQLTPLLTKVVRQGAEEGLFKTQYPEEAAEFLFLGLGYTIEMIRLSGSDETRKRKLKAVEDISARVLGIKPEYLRLI